MPGLSEREQHLADRLFLALRQCATHSAGPLRAVAELHASTIPECAAALADVRRRLVEQGMPDDRREVVDAFLAVVETGLVG